MLGVVTELGRSQDEELEQTFKRIIPYWGTPDEGSSTTMVAALDPALNGKYPPWLLILRKRTDGR